MSKHWIDRDAVRKQLSSFFSDNRDDVNKFGTTVNQTFEAFVFASVINWYADHGWNVKFVHPKKSGSYAKLKFSTRGRPDEYTYAICKKGKQIIQVRHCL